MILTLILLAGCASWALGELIMLASGQISAAAGWAATLGIYVAGAGMFALKDLPTVGKAGRVGIALSAFGAFSFATVYTIILTAGVLGALAEGSLRHAEMVFTPFYLLALAFAIAGLISLAIHFRAAGDRVAMAGAIFLAAAGLARLFLADIAPYHELVSALSAFYFAALGARRLRNGSQRTA